MKKTNDEAVKGFDIENSANFLQLYEKIQFFIDKVPTFKELLNYPDAFLEDLYNMAIYFYNAQKFKSSLEVLSILMQLDIKNKYYPYLAAACYQGLKDFDKAIAYYLMAFSKDTSNPEPLFYAAEVCLAVKKEAAALDLFKKLSKLTSNKKEFDQMKKRADLILEGAKKTS
jgi:tetratricopeptide (TPR) repeat protein